MALLWFVIGSLFGSFFMVVGTKLPLKENVITRRSHCDNCQKELKWYELIPIFSYIFLKGECHNCHSKIGIDNLLMEIFSALLFILGFLFFGLTFRFGIYLTIISVALIIIVSDFKYMIILDSPLVVGSILVMVFRYLETDLKTVFYSILYGIAAFIVMYLIKLLGDKMFKRESLGGGDIKLAFLIGLTLGYPSIGFRLSLISLIFSAFLALPYAIMSVYINEKNELPFGPFLISAMIIIFVFIDKFSNLLILFSL